jgi:AdoMet-dependent rRNA methyltransferase SPB1
LNDAKIVLDLCAAPGGWTQVAARTMAKQETLIVAVDILPIRSLGPNVITLIGDITTDSCKAEIRQTLQQRLVDVVLHDGAPNIGASYGKDAYVQNELALHALKCATQHLKPKGHFCTKLYRSRDYASFLWVAQQLFRNVQAVKPTASRTQSAEIFLVCQNYIAPSKIDPKMLDPKHVFEAVEGDTTGGGNASGSGSTSKFNVFHKQWDQQKRPNRSGYDMAEMDFSMRRVVSIRDFIEGKPSSDENSPKIGMGPIEILSNCTGMAFMCHACRPDASKDAKKDTCNCQIYLQHRATTPEIKTCVSDLKVLNKSDFKALLTWRGKILDSLKEMEEKESDGESDESLDESVSERKLSTAADEEDEEKIQQEIEHMRQRRLRQKKKMKKKERTLASKRRRRAAFGMDLNAIDVPEHDALFTLATITTAGELEAAREVDLDKVTHSEIFGGSDEESDASNESDAESQGEKFEIDDDTGYNYNLDRDLDDAYETYLRNTKDSKAKVGTKMAKRSKKAQRIKALMETEEDDELAMAGNNATLMSDDMKRYAKLLNGGNDSDESEKDDQDESADEEEDGYFEEPRTPDEHAKIKSSLATKKSSNPLIHTLEEPKSAKTARWFSNPLFETIGNAASLAAMTDGRSKSSMVVNGDYDSESDNDDFEDDDAMDCEDSVQEGSSSGDKASRKRKTVLDVKEKKQNNGGKRLGLNADDVLASMPKTDKQIRHEKRLKALARDERRQAKKAKKSGEDTLGEFEIAAAEEEQEEIAKLEGLTAEKKAKILEARALIKAGLGQTMDNENKTSNFEVVSTQDTRDSGRSLPLVDTRQYDSENEDYDSDDYVQTLALGTMMLRQSKAKALVDASYNRFAWNDPQDLPDWFVDDENRHYRPQLPIPQSLIDKIKAKQLTLSSRPIAKVAEARARKSRKAKLKIMAAKKKAEVVAASSDMSEAMKLKAISKAMRGKDGQKSPGKTYVIARKGGTNKGGKNMKVVDKRLKSDKRAMDRKDKVNKKGKQNGLTGSKKRRHHK